MKRLLITPLLLVVVFTSCGESARTLSTRSPSPQPSTPSSPIGDFDGTIHGWRIAPNAVLEAEFGNDLRNLDLDCEPRRVTPGTPTDLDVTFSYFPESATRQGKPNVDKWVCGSEGLSVFYEYSLKVKPFPVVGETGYLRIDRVVTGRRAQSIGTSPADRVHECTVAGLPAVCFRNEAEGHILILVIEDDELDPHARYLLVDAEGIPFDELVKMIEGLK